MTTHMIPEYEYLDSTPDDGDVFVFLSALANEAQYLAGDEGTIPDGFEVGVDSWGAGTVRYLIDTATGERVDQVS